MSQQVIVTTDAAIALKPLIESAIRSELRMLELGLARTVQRLHVFEDQYGLTSKEFERRFAAGEVDESNVVSASPPDIISEPFPPSPVKLGNALSCLYLAGV